ncbi:MAG: uracil-DNA glycosylase [Anaerolineae bacterium]|nr:uracil-DNA glycosylase [Anaerolineae bacterium]
MTNLMLPGFGDDAPLPPPSMADLRQQALGCTRCRLHATRQQVVWGQGDPHSPLMMVGQGPSVTDDRTGDIYSGPAGEELDAVLAEAGLQRAQIYLTNIHKCVARQKADPYNIRPPTKTELQACRPWLDGELGLVKPRVLVCVGGPAAQGLLGADFDLSAQRGEWVQGPGGVRALATFQPTYITRLRQHDPARADLAYRQLVGDLQKAAVAAGLAAAP